jgi:hypothetical protein
MIELQVEDLLTIGWIKIDWIGAENVYLSDEEGKAYFVKIHPWDPATVPYIVTEESR